MGHESEPEGLDRRGFLKAVGLGAAVGVAPLAVPEARADSENDSEKRKPRYRETDHVKTFYRVNRY